MANPSGDAPTVEAAISNFKVHEILDVNPRLKYAALSGKIDGTDQMAVAVLHKDGFDSAKLQLLFNEAADWSAFLNNDIYGGFTVKNPPAELSSIKATFIYPATEKHVQKYRKQDFFLVVETPEIYDSVVRPHFESMKFSLQWVYNILDHKTEADRIVFEDPDDSTGFVLLPDLKWSGEKTEELYLVAIVRRRDVGSLRDLRHEHIPLLKNILEKGTEAIKKTYGVPASKLKVYVHYHPTYSHFHVHFIHLSQEGYGSGIERGHPLSTVISNLSIDPNYYTKVELPITVRDNDPLKKLLEERGVVVS